MKVMAFALAAVEVLFGCPLFFPLLALPPSSESSARLVGFDALHHIEEV